MTLSVVCPICNANVTCEFDGTLFGIVSIAELSIMELTAPAEISAHINSHKTVREDGQGFEWDGRYWQRLRTHHEYRAKASAKILEHLPKGES